MLRLRSTSAFVAALVIAVSILFGTRSALAQGIGVIQKPAATKIWTSVNKNKQSSTNKTKQPVKANSRGNGNRALPIPPALPVVAPPAPAPVPVPTPPAVVVAQPTLAPAADEAEAATLVVLNKDVDNKTVLQVMTTITTTATTFASAAIAAGLMSALSGAGPYTILAPDNLAFTKLPNDALWNKLLQDPAWILHWRNVLLYHIHHGAAVQLDSLTTTAIATSGPNAAAPRKLRMMNGQDVDIIAVGENVVKVNDQAHAIAYYEPKNGVAYLIDQVLLPDFLTQSIVKVATSATSTLSSLVVMAGLEDTWSRAGADVTVFAPTNAAFAALNPSMLAALQTDIGAAGLKTMLLYHVLPGVYPTVNIPVGHSKLPSLASGQVLNIVRNDQGTVIVNEVLVATPNVLANNGIIHLLPQVLFPPNLSNTGGAAPAPVPVSSNLTASTAPVASITTAAPVPAAPAPTPVVPVVPVVPPARPTNPPVPAIMLVPAPIPVVPAVPVVPPARPTNPPVPAIMPVPAAPAPVPVPAVPAVPMVPAAGSIGDLILAENSRLWILLLIVDLDDFVKNTKGLTVSIICDANFWISCFCCCHCYGSF
jgi:uncharacterized surface protein with fasciclin (FAS1) repeats